MYEVVLNLSNPGDPYSDIYRLGGPMSAVVSLVKVVFVVVYAPEDQKQTLWFSFWGPIYFSLGLCRTTALNGMFSGQNFNCSQDHFDLLISSINSCLNMVMCEHGIS